MSYYGSATRSVTATYTQARRLAARVAAELKQIQSLYGRPDSERIEEYAIELETYLTAEFLDHVQYGFRKNGVVILGLKYTPEDATGIDDKPGRIPVGVDVSGAAWFSYLEHNDQWLSRPQAERDAFERDLPFQREGAQVPRYAAGVIDRGTKRYSEDILGLRREVRSL